MKSNRSIVVFKFFCEQLSTYKLSIGDIKHKDIYIGINQYASKKKICDDSAVSVPHVAL